MTANNDQALSQDEQRRRDDARANDSLHWQDECSICGGTHRAYGKLCDCDVVDAEFDPSSQVHPESAMPSGLALLTEAAPAAPEQAVPEGWKRVPVKPDAAMLEAAAKADDEGFEAGRSHGASGREIYDAMLAAAPVPPVPAPAEADQPHVMPPMRGTGSQLDTARAAIINALSAHRMVHMYEVEDDGALGNSYPLIDRLCLDDGRDIASGKAEVEAIADAVLDAMDEQLLASRCRAPGGNTSIDTEELPPLPEPWITDMSTKDPAAREHYARDQMDDYARAAVAAHVARQAQAAPVAEVDADDDGLFIGIIYGEDGSPLKVGDKLYLAAPTLGGAPQAERAAVPTTHEGRQAFVRDFGGPPMANAVLRGRLSLNDAVALVAAAPLAPQPRPVRPIPTEAQAQADEAQRYRDLTGDVLALGYQGLADAAQALRKVKAAPSGTDGSAQAAPTDLSKRLREMFASWTGTQGFDHRFLLAAADEIERYYGGMLAWKRTAEAKDREGAAAQAAPAEQRDAWPDEEALRDAVTEGLRGLYGCGRVWSAWSVGTMTEDDFHPADESDECIGQVMDAIRALRTTTTAAQQESPCKQ